MPAPVYDMFPKEPGQKKTVLVFSILIIVLAIIVCINHNHPIS